MDWMSRGVRPISFPRWLSEPTRLRGMVAAVALIGGRVALRGIDMAGYGRRMRRRGWIQYVQSAADAQMHGWMPMH